MKEIPLTQGMVTQVDDQDYEYLAQWKWRLQKSFNCTYAVRDERLNGQRAATILMHRVILDTPDEFETDHKDGNGLNNCRSNLRPANHQQNMQNRRHNKNACSQYRGVEHKKNTRGGKFRWVARIKAGKIRQRLGGYATEQEAALAYNQAALKYFGEFARLNIVSP